MSRLQKLKATEKKQKEAAWNAGRTARLLDRLREGRVPDVNPAYQRLFAEQISPPAREPYSGSPQDAASGSGSGSTPVIDEETGLPCIDIPLREFQPVRLVDTRTDQFETPFGDAGGVVELQSDEQASVGQGSVSLADELLEDSLEARNRVRRANNQRQGVPSHYDDTYVDVYGDQPAVHVPSAFLRDDCESRLNALFPGSKDNRRRKDEADTSATGAEHQCDVSAVEREPRQARRGFVHPYDDPCFLTLHVTVVEQLLKKEKWFRTYYHWAVALRNRHVMLPDESALPIRRLLQQNMAKGGFFHSWMVYPALNLEDDEGAGDLGGEEGAEGDPTGERARLREERRQEQMLRRTQGRTAATASGAMAEARLLIKFNNYTAVQQAELAVQQEQEEMFQKADTISSYIFDYGCCAFRLVGLDPLPLNGDEIAKSGARVRIKFINFGFL